MLFTFIIDHILILLYWYFKTRMISIDLLCVVILADHFYQMISTRFNFDVLCFEPHYACSFDYLIGCVFYIDDGTSDDSAVEFPASTPAVLWLEPRDLPLKLSLTIEVLYWFIPIEWLPCPACIDGRYLACLLSEFAYSETGAC